MKKLVLLLLVMAMGAGVVFAASGPIHPPGAYGFEAALSGYSVDGLAVTPDTVLVTEAPVMADLSSFQAVMAVSAIRPHIGMMNITCMPMEFRQACTLFAETNYHLRC